MATWGAALQFHCFYICPFYRSQTFFYSAGVSIGIFASLVFLVLVLARLFPRVCNVILFYKYLSFMSDHCLHVS